MAVFVKLDIFKIKSKITRRVGDLVQPKIDNMVLKDSNFYAPENEGFLQASGITGSKIGKGVLQWTVPYAREQYYGMPNKSKSKNPNAQMKWFEVAKAKNGKYWITKANEWYKGKA
jgi:hypothetical protein